MNDHLSSSILNALVDGELSADQLAGRKRASCRLPLVHLKCLVSKPAQIGHSEGRSAVRAADPTAGAFGIPSKIRGCRRQVCALSMCLHQVQTGDLACWASPPGCFWLSPQALCLCSTTLEKRSLLWLSTMRWLPRSSISTSLTLAGSLPPEVVSTDRHTVKPWFQGKIPFSFNLPQNLPPGMMLYGANLTYCIPTDCRASRSIGKHRVSVFVGEELERARMSCRQSSRDFR